MELLISFFVQNHLPTTAPFEKIPKFWIDQAPFVSRFQKFGCIAYVHVPKETQQKLNPLGLRFFL